MDKVLNLKMGIAASAVGVCVLGVLWFALARPSSATSVRASTDAAETPVGDAPAEAGEGASDASYVADVVLVQVDKGMGADEVSAALSEAGVKTVDPGTVEAVTGGYVQVSVTKGHTVEEAMDELATLPFVVTSQPNFVYRVDAGE